MRVRCCRWRASDPGYGRRVTATVTPMSAWAATHSAGAFPKLSRSPFGQSGGLRPSPSRHPRPRSNPLWVKPLIRGCVGRVEAARRRRAYGCWRVREWLGPKSRCAGCEPATLDDRDVPGCPPGPAYWLGGGVDEELAVDGVADVALQRADGVLLGLALGELAVEVGAALGAAAGGSGRSRRGAGRG